MAIIGQSLLILTVLIVFTAGYYEDGYGDSDDNKNIADTTWEKIFKSNRQPSTLPLFRYKNKLYYMGVHFRAKWTTALDFCEKLHMNLLTIHSKDENDRIHKYIRDASKGTEYWTGGTRLVDGSKWVWMPYSTQIDYTHWSNGQPDNVNEQCLQLWITDNQLTWNDRDCNTEFFFICERYMNSDNSGPPGL